MATEVDFYQAITLGIGSGALIGVFTLVWNLSAYKTRQERNTLQIVASLRGLVSLIKDEGERRLLEAGLATINSPARLNYGSLRELVRERGRPPEYVHEAIRRIVEDTTLDEDWKVIGAIAAAFTPEQLQRAYATHGGDASTFNAMALLVIADARELGLEFVLRESGLME